MFVRPEDLSDGMVEDAWREGWGVDVDEVSYAAVGFGSHHWHGTAAGQRWFLTVDQVDDGGQRLTHALSTAAELRTDRREWVVAPIAAVDGALLQPVAHDYVLAVYPWIGGEAGSFGGYADDSERHAVIERLVDLHGANASQLPVRTDELTIPARTELAATLEDLDSAWTTGPFADQARALLTEQRALLVATLQRYDELAAPVSARTDGYVVTHGEPHRGNVIFTADGPALIDWDTALLAPPERDLWRLIDEDGRARQNYERLSGRTLDDQTLLLYRLWWDLSEVSLYTAGFRAPHTKNQDTTTAWRALQQSVSKLRSLDDTSCTHLGA